MDRRGSAMADEPLPSALSERDHQHLFWHEIAPLYFPEGLGRAAAPTAAFLGGQPGAGRTRLLHEVTAALTAQGPTVVIGGADLRPFHPADGHLQRTDPLGAAHATDPDTPRWVEMLIAEGRRRGVHLVIDGSLGRPEVFAHRAGALRAAGYRVEAHVLAVSPEWSWQGVHQRRERLIAQGGASRAPTRDAHDAAVAGLLRTVAAIDADGLADHVRVTTRAGQTIDQNSRRGRLNGSRRPGRRSSPRWAAAPGARWIWIGIW
jgi:UDP-N-acetylglucosamine kinase